MKVNYIDDEKIIEDAVKDAKKVNIFRIISN